MCAMDRRVFLTGSIAAIATPALTAPLSRYGLDAAQFGVHPGAPDDQSTKLQRAIEQAARSRTPLVLAPGVYRAANLRLPAGTQLLGVRGATQLALTRDASLLLAEHGDTITLSGLVLDGGGRTLSDGRGLVHVVDVRGLRIGDCDIRSAGGNGIALEQCGGAVTGVTITDAADNALFCNDSREVILSGNSIRGAGNGGIRVWQSDKREDGTIVADNRIEDTYARSGGDGQNGNAINIYRAGRVIVRGNQIRNAAFSAVRGNQASNIQIVGNNCAGLGETALYSEFGFQGAVIAQNVVDGAENGVSITNFSGGGRLATVQGNLLRNLGPRQSGRKPQEAGVGIGVEADTAATGNTVDTATTAGIRAGWGPYLRNVTITGNVLRNAAAGIEVSVASGAGAAAITGNVIASAKRGAILGMEWDRQVADLAGGDAARYPQLTIANNRTS
jgi:uncharacterized secreted repeat protein (TIGR03808 family)